MTDRVRLDGFVASLIPDPMRAGEVVALMGYFGKSPKDEHVRLYFDISLRSHVDVPNADILHVVPVPESVSPLGGSYIWVRADADFLRMEPPITVACRGGDPITVGQTCPRPSENLSCPPTPYPAGCAPTNSFDCRTQDFSCRTQDFSCRTQDWVCRTSDWSCPTRDVACQTRTCPAPMTRTCPAPTTRMCPTTSPQQCSTRFACGYPGAYWATTGGGGDASAATGCEFAGSEFQRWGPWRTDAYGNPYAGPVPPWRFNPYQCAPPSPTYAGACW